MGGLQKVIMTVAIQVASADDMQHRMLRAFMPAIRAVQALAFPLAFMWASIGVLLIINDQKQQGMQKIKAAMVGYLAMQLLPGLMSIVAEVGREMGPLVP